MQGCLNEGQESPIISNDLEVCSAQPLKNVALWDYMNDWYLWNESLDQSTRVEEFASLTDIFANIREKNPIDRFSHIMSKKEYDDYFTNAEAFDYGMSAQIDELNNELAITFVYTDSNAAKIGLKRGDRILAINGKNLNEAMTSDDFLWSEFWGDIDTSEMVEFTWRSLEGVEITKQMNQSVVTTNTVFATKVIESELGKIGYLVYNSFIEFSHDELNQAFRFFREEKVVELIVDLRYNHGGLSRISNQLASQIGGENVMGQIYNIPANNANHQSDIEFFNLNGATDWLNLSRVVFITTQESASGSEVLINSLKPYLDVKLVGEKTYGKPVGMRVAQLCDEMVLAITHHNHNADGFGDFFDGIPVDCPASDTINSAWGDMQDAMLFEAVYLLNNEQCSDNLSTEKNSLNPILKTASYPSILNLSPFVKVDSQGLVKDVVEYKNRDTAKENK